MFGKPPPPEAGAYVTDEFELFEVIYTTKDFHLALNNSCTAERRYVPVAEIGGPLWRVVVPDVIEAA